MEAQGMNGYMNDVVKIAEQSPPVQGKLVISNRDIDHDGLLDPIEINFEDAQYKLKLTLSGMTIQSGFSSKIIEFEKRYDSARLMFNHLVMNSPRVHTFDPDKAGLQKYYSKDPDGRTTLALDWDAVYRDYPILRFLEAPATPPAQKACTALLFRSASFRDILIKVQKLGVKIIQGTGNESSAGQNMVLLALDAQHLNFLPTMPHEFTHSLQPPDNMKSAELFVDTRMKFEVEADAAALKIMYDEVGFSPSPASPHYDTYLAHKEGPLAARRNKERSIASGDKEGMNYVETFYFSYQWVKGKDKTITVQSRFKLMQFFDRPTQAMIANTISRRDKSSVELADIAIAEAATIYPPLADYLKRERAKLEKIATLIRSINSHKDNAAEQVAVMLTLFELRNGFLTPEYEKVRLEHIRQFPALAKLYK